MPGKFSSLRAYTAPRPAEVAAGRVAERIVLAIVVLALLVPFLGKPFHIDDPVFLAIANQVRAHPLDPYGFDYYWFDAANRMWDLDPLNPPGMGYLLAPLIALVGERELPLHAVFLLFPVLAALSAYEIARRFTERPFGAALLFCVAPMFVVPATTVMADLPALACLLGAVALLLRAVEGRPGAAVLSGLAATAAVLLKYTAALVIPVLLVGLVLLDRRPLRHAWCVVLPLLALLGWEAVTLTQQGSSHVVEAARTSRAAGLPAREMLLAAATFFFLGMGAGPVLLVARLRRREGWLALALGAPLGFGLVALYGRANAQYEGWGPLTVATALAATGGIALAALAAREAFERRAPGLFLLAWFLGGVAQVVFFGSFVAARYLLPALLPAVLLLARRGRAETLIGAALAAALSLGVGYADLEYAKAFRDAAATLQARYGGAGRPLRYQGHWGFQYYMERLGARPLYPDEAPLLEAGEVVAIPRDAANVSRRLLALAAWDRKRVMPEQVLTLAGRGPLSAMSMETGAGFYCSFRAPLPFSWAPGALDQIEILKIVEIPSGGR